MTSKKRRQRGSRTHGGGTHKNRRGAGNRGGRGRAGRSKHEFHNYEDLGKSGFSPPGDDPDKVIVNLKELDTLVYEAYIGAESQAEMHGDSSDSSDPESGSHTTATDGGVSTVQAGVELSHSNSITRVDLTKVHSDADIVKLLGSGSLSRAIQVMVDACSINAKRAVKAAGGSVHLSNNGWITRTAVEEVIGRRFRINHGNSNMNLEEFLETVRDGQPLEPSEFDKVVSNADKDIDLAYEIMKHHAELIDEPTGLEILNLMRSRDFAREHGLDPSMFERLISVYFEDIDLSEAYRKSLVQDLPEHMTVDDALGGLERIHDSYRIDAYENNPDLRESRIREDEKEYLSAVDEVTHWS